MFCEHCGIFNAAGNANCAVCGKATPKAERPAEPTIYADLRDYSFWRILRSIRINRGRLVLLLILPFFLPRYLYKNMVGKPMLTPIARDGAGKFIIADLKKTKRLLGKPVIRAMRWLGGQGFVPFIEYEDAAAPRRSSHHVLVHPLHAIYCTVIPSIGRQRLAMLRFFAMTSEKRAVILETEQSVLPELPPNIVFQTLPGASTADAYGRFIELVDDQPGRPKMLSLKHFFRLNYQIRRRILDLGLKQGVYYLKKRG